MRIVVGLVVALAATSSHAYDSLACGPSLAPLRLDCDGITAARTPWVQSEHAAIWLHARELSGLPEALDEPFEVTTFVGDGFVSDTDGGQFESLEVVPLGLVRDVLPRTIEVARQGLRLVGLDFRQRGLPSDKFGGRRARVSQV